MRTTKTNGTSMRQVCSLLFGLAFSLVSIQSFAQQSITGVVTDGSTGEGLPGVTIRIKGSSTGTITDFDGNYTIEAASGDILVFSSIGFASQEIVVGNQSSVDILLAEDVSELNEVVVIGYGSVQKKDLTGVVNKVGSDDFNKGMFASPKQLLAGKVSGVQIAQDGNPRGGGSVRIRGGSSFAGDQEPLYVIDGVPMSKSMGHGEGGQDPLSFINPGDIEDVTVLKDASAAAIYGVQGAAGVILITTKSGQSGKPKYSYNGSFEASIAQKGPDMLTTEEFGIAVGLHGPRNLARLRDADTDWVDEVTRLATSQNHTVSMSTGDANNTLRVSLNYLDRNGVLLTDRTQRIGPSLKYTRKLLGDDLNLSLSYNGYMNRDRLAPNVMGGALAYAPTQPVTDDNPARGNYYEWGQPLAPGNPVSVLEQSFNQNRGIRHNIGMTFDYKLPFMDGLSFKGNAGYDNLISRSQSISLPTLNPTGTNEVLWGGLWMQRAVVETRTYEAYLNYKKKFGIHSVDIIGGHSYQDFYGNYPSVSKNAQVHFDDYGIGDPLEFLDDSYKVDNIDILQKGDPAKATYRLASLYGRLNYSLNEKYLFTGTLRYDGSSRFGRSNDFNIFPSMALAWRVIDEPFMEGLEGTIDDLKFRIGYGVVGNQNIGQDFGYVDLYSLGNERAQYIIGSDTVSILRPSGADPNIQWEQTSSLNFGIDFSLFSGRVNGQIDYYEKETSDLLSRTVFPVGVLTAPVVWTNIAAFEVKGFELALSSYVIDNSNFTWELAANATTFRDEITELNFTNNPDFFGITRGGISGDVGQSIQVLRIGERINSFLVYDHIFVDGKPVSDTQDRDGNGIANDLDMYVDQDDNGIINENDLITFEAPSPKIMFGLTSNMSYKKWDLSFTLRAQLGNYVYNNIASQFGAYEGVNDNFAPRNIHISAFENDFTEKQLFSNIYVEDASFLKLDNISVGYSFEDLAGIRGRAFVVANNVFVLTKYSGTDPEVGISGIDNNPYPRSRAFVLGLNLNLN